MSELSLLVATWLASAFLLFQAPEPPRVSWGVYELDGSDSPARSIPQDRSLPIEWALASVTWEHLQPSPNEFRWDILDRLTEQAETRGIKLVYRVIPYAPPHTWKHPTGLTEMPKWLKEKDLVLSAPSALVPGRRAEEPKVWEASYSKLWAEAQRAVILRYGTRGTTLGFWLSLNEWGEVNNLYSEPEITKLYPPSGYTKEKMLEAVRLLVSAVETARKEAKAESKHFQVIGVGFHDGIPEPGRPTNPWSAQVSDGILDACLAVPNLWYGNAALQGTPMSQSQREALRMAQSKGIPLVLYENEPSKSLEELQKKLEIARQWKPRAVALFAETWNIPGCRLAIDEYSRR
jgi:hypothetical protein